MPGGRIGYPFWRVPLFLVSGRAMTETDSSVLRKKQREESLEFTSETLGGMHSFEIGSAHLLHCLSFLAACAVFLVLFPFCMFVCVYLRVHLKAQVSRIPCKAARSNPVALKARPPQRAEETWRDQSVGCQEEEEEEAEDETSGLLT